MLAGPPLAWAAATLGGGPKERSAAPRNNSPTGAAALVSRAKTGNTARCGREELNCGAGADAGKRGDAARASYQASD